MSTIGVTYHNEDIHNIIKEPVPPIIKAPMYKSKRIKPQQGGPAADKGGIGVHKGKSGHQTFGLAHYETPDAHNFLKKKSGHKPLVPADKKEFACTSGCTLPRLPKWGIECPKSSGKNFVKENIKWVESLEPKVPQPRKVDSPRGTVKDLRHLIAMIKKRETDAYGKVPEYLCERKKQMETYMERKKRQKEIEETYKEQMGIGHRGMGENVYMVDKETREKLLQGLKEHWNELSKQFLKLPVMCDTMTKIRRKLWLEKEIDRIEKDVKMVERHPYIYLERQDKRDTKEIAADILRQQEEMERKAKEERKKERELIQEQTEEAKEDDQEVEVHNYEREVEK